MIIIFASFNPPPLPPENNNNIYANMSYCLQFVCVYFCTFVCLYLLTQIFFSHPWTACDDETFCDNFYGIYFYSPSICCLLSHFYAQYTLDTQDIFRKLTRFATVGLGCTSVEKNRFAPTPPLTPSFYVHCFNLFVCIVAVVVARINVSRRHPQKFDDLWKYQQTRYSQMKVAFTSSIRHYCD